MDLMVVEEVVVCGMLRSMGCEILNEMWKRSKTGLLDCYKFSVGILRKCEEWKRIKDWGIEQKRVYFKID